MRRRGEKRRKEKRREEKRREEKRRGEERREENRERWGELWVGFCDLREFWCGRLAEDGFVVLRTYTILLGGVGMLQLHMCRGPTDVGWRGEERKGKKRRGEERGKRKWWGRRCR